MKNLLLIVTMMMAAATVLGYPCWDYPAAGGCGDIPACKPGQPPANATWAQCAHVYCDDAQSCPDGSGQKRMMMTVRNVYGWNSNGNDYYCVGAGSTTPAQTCCSCQRPGVVTSPSTAD